MNRKKTKKTKEKETKLEVLQEGKQPVKEIDNNAKTQRNSSKQGFVSQKIKTTKRPKSTDACEKKKQRKEETVCCVFIFRT